MHVLELCFPIQRVDFLQTALDTTVKGRYVDLTVLTQDENGQVSEEFSSGEEQKQPDVEEGTKKSAESLYRKVAQSDCEVRNILLQLYLIVQVIQQYWSASGSIESISNPLFVRPVVVQYCYVTFLETSSTCSRVSDQYSSTHSHLTHSPTLHTLPPYTLPPYTLPPYTFLTHSPTLHTPALHTPTSHTPALHTPTLHTSLVSLIKNFLQKGKYFHTKLPDGK